MARHLSLYNVPEKPCHTCPFGGREPIALPPDRLAYYYEQLLNGGSQHLCHSNNKTICRGGRTIQLRWFCSISLIKETTDEAFNQAVAELTKNNRNPENISKTNQCVSETQRLFLFV